MNTLKISDNYNSDSEALEHAKIFQHLSDSMRLADLTIKDQFAKIRYETNEKEQELLRNKESLLKQSISIKNKQLQLLCLLLTLIILTIVTRAYYVKNKKYKHQLNDSVLELKALNKKSFYVHSNQFEDDKLRLQFDSLLKEKYNLTDKILELWKLQTEGLNESEITDRIGLITKEGVRKRRNKLYKKIELVEHTGVKMNALKAIGVFKKELIEFEDLR